MSLIPKKGTVYVVDDDEAVRDSLQWLLEGKDYRVKCFDSAESFLSRFDPREVACLLVDIRMPEVDGFELINHLRQIQPESAVLIMTGHGTVETAIRALRQGVDGLQIVYLKGSYELIWSRLAQRQGHYMKPKMLRSQFDTLEEPTDALTLDIRAGVETIVDEIIDCLPNKS